MEIIDPPRVLFFTECPIYRLPVRSNMSGWTAQNVNMSGFRIDNANAAGLHIVDANLAGAAISNCRIEGMTIDGISVEDALAAYRQSKAA